MKGKIGEKIIASLVIFMLTISDFGFLMKEAYAELEELEMQKIQTNNKNVEFDVYFKNDQTITHSKTENKQNTGKIYMNLNIKSGYLKEAKVVLEDPNFAMQKSESKIITSIDNDTIQFSQMDTKTEVEIPYVFEKQDPIAMKYFNKDTKAILTGIYVDVNGKEKEITGEVTVHLSWDEDITGKIEQSVEKVISLGNNLTLLEMEIRSQIEQNRLPAEKTTIHIQTPQIENANIKEVKVYAESTIEANGTEDGTSFTSEQWNYNEESKQIEINIENPNIDGKLSWKTGEDQFKVIYIIESTDEIVGKNINLNINGEIRFQEKVATLKENKDISLEAKGNILNGKIEATSELNKGYLYANSNYETNYQTKWEVSVSYANVIDNIHISGVEDSYLTKEGHAVGGNNSTYYKNSRIKKSNFDQLLGEEGKIEIYTDGNKVNEVNKDTVADEQGDILISYEGQVSNLELVTTKPIKEGKLIIANEKAIKSQVNYNIEILKQLGKIESKMNLRSNLTEEEYKTEINLNETITKAEIQKGDTSPLSTVIKNNNVEIRAMLRTEESKYDLYKNPYLEVELPSEITDVEINSIELLFSDELNIVAYDVITNEVGNKVICIQIEGNQTKYSAELGKGVNVILNTNLTLDKKSATVTKQIIMRYTNEKAIAFDNNGIATADIEIEAPTGVVTINSLANFRENQEVTSLSSRENVGDLEILTASKIATMTIDIVNNYGTDIKEVNVLGRVPFTGNKKTDGKALGTTFDTKLKSALRANEVNANYMIYYTENGEATKDLQDVNNRWTTDIENIENIKSYLIVFSDYTMKQSEAISFSYDIEIPEDLNHNESTFGTYTVYYDAIEENAVRKENVIAPTVGATTGEGPELEVTIEADVAKNVSVQEGQLIKYTAKVNNIGNVIAKKVKLTGIVPEVGTYMEYQQGDIYTPSSYVEKKDQKEIFFEKEELQVGESFALEYLVRVNTREYEGGETDEDKETRVKDLIAKAKVTADELEKEISTEDYVNPVEKGIYTFELNNFPTDTMVIKEGTEITYTATLRNVNNENKDNIIIKNILPEGITYKDAYIKDSSNQIKDGVTYQEEGRTVTWNIGTLTGSKVIRVVLVATTDAFKSGETEKTITNAFKVTSAQKTDEMNTNEVKNYMARAALQVTHSSDKPEGTLTDKDTISYRITVKNIGNTVAKRVTVTDYIPNGLIFDKSTYQLNDTTGNSKVGDKEAKIVLDIPVGETLSIDVIAEAETLQGVEEKEIVNKVEVVCENAEEIQVPELKHIIKANKEIETPDGDKVTVYNISGTAWEDLNKDGKKDDSEPKLSNIDVILMDANSGDIAKKVSEQTEQKVTTDEEGKYTFTEVKSGDYIVIFLYDSEKYTLTEYKKQEISEFENSDAIRMQVIMDGVTTMAAVTDKLTLKDSSITGVNIGLMQIPTFKLGLNKTVSKIVVQNKKETKTVTFNESKLAKVDVDGKYINNTNIIIEYKIKVTNTGDVAGYAKKIVDTIPKELKFSSELNKDWYLGKNGEAYSTSLSNVLIKPGESKELILLLTKVMDENGNKIVHNISDLSEIYNEYGVENSEKITNEHKSADVIIGLKTGKTISYISLIIAIMGVIGLGAYYINKKVLSKI